MAEAYYIFSDTAFLARHFRADIENKKHNMEMARSFANQSSSLPFFPPQAVSW